MPTDENFRVMRQYSDTDSTAPEDVVPGAETEYDIGTHQFPADQDFSSSHVMRITVNYNATQGPLAPINDAIYQAGRDVFATAQRGLRELFSTGRLSSGAFDLENPIQFNTNDVTPEAARRLLLGEYKAAKGAILLYMPSTAAYTNTIQYEDVSLTSLAQDKLSSFVGIIPGARALLGGGASLVGDAAKDIQRLKGLPINPKVEILFSNIPQRSFQYDFLFAPETPGEAATVKNIIQILREEAAPEEIGVAGIIWKAPSTFNISFEHNGAENTNIPKINECVLEKIDVDYAPTGFWSTFTNGFPVSVRLQLQFREREPNHKKWIKKGY